MKPYDLVVIGSGPAGEKGAAQAAYFGKSVALIEKSPYVGGACVNTGTIPSKTLREAALAISGFKQRELYGLDFAIKSNVAITDLMVPKDRVIEIERRMIELNLERHHVERYVGTARLLSPHEIEITAGETREVIQGEIILIATGSSPYRPPDIPFDDVHICDSDSILDMDHIPSSLAVVGAGVIGCEYASIFAALGVKVYLIDGRTDLLGHIDREIAAVLLEVMQHRLEVEMCLGENVRSVTPRPADIHLVIGDGVEIAVEKVLVAAGRNSNTAGMGLEEAGVKLGKRGLVLVDEHYCTSVANIYAAGDVIGFPALASTSMEQARVAMVHAFDLKYKTRVASILPYGIYTIPELSTVGMTEAECQEKGIDYEVGRASYRANARGQIIGDADGRIKLVFDAESLKLLGVHIVGENASELLHVGMMVMQFDGTINAFIESVFNFPTLGDAYKYAAYDGLGNMAKRRAT